MVLHRWRVGSLVAVALLCSQSATVLARGGGHGGGGHGGGGRGGFAGGGAHAAGAPAAHFAGASGYGHPGYRTFGGPRGYYGGYRGGYGWGYPYYGIGAFGLGLGLGYGLGYGYGSPYYGYYGYSPYYAAVPATTVIVPAGNVYGTPPGSSTTYTGSSPSQAGQSPGAPPSETELPPAPAPTPMLEPEGDPESAAEFSRKGMVAFHAGKYSKAVYEWRHAVVDDPKNPRQLLFLSQALFAIGRYEEAAGAAQAGMRMLPKEEWGTVIATHRELYGRNEDYTTQLRTLEKAIHTRPKDPALRFLAGYHYSYLGFRKEAIEQLDRALIESNRDEIAMELRKTTLDSLSKSASVATKPQSIGRN